jgi:TatD DNase family protein
MLQDFKDLKKVFHCYSADWDFAQNFLDQVTYFSFTGSITYAKKGRVINTIRNLPLEKIMIETDCPYLTPSDYRGQENQPGFVLKVAQKVAEVKACTLSEVLEKTTRNAREFFQI